ncbi:MAG: hypothetical protein IKY02_00265 [Lachnospiraceae bacterium]|nr:hypothetical protein [Lachnospiraceae bacterium]
MTKMLLLPFYCEGYDETLFRQHLASYVQDLTACGFEVTPEEPIGTYEQAEIVQKTTAPFLYDICALLPVTWSEPRLASVAARAFFDRPLLVLAVNEFSLGGKRTEFSSAPAAAALYGSLSEMGVPALFLPGPIRLQERKLRAIARAAGALSALRTARIGAVGHNFNGITAAGLDLSALRRRLGTEVYSFDGSTVIRRAEALEPDSELYRKTEAEVSAAYTGLPEAYREKVVRITAALQGMIDEYGLDALEVRCHTEFSMEYGLSMCLPLGILGNRIAAACEADLPVLLTELIFKYLSDGKTPTYADLRTFTDEGMDVGACGFAPTALTGNTGAVGGENGYLTNTSDLSEGTLTIGRLLKKPGGRWLLHADSAKASRIESRLTEFGCAPYPMARILPSHGMEWFKKATGANHYAIVYEDLTEELSAFTYFAGIGLL